MRRFMISMQEKTISRIMFVISSMAANGAERVMSLLVNESAKQGIESLLILVSQDTVEYTIDPRVKIVYAGGTDTFQRIKNIRKQIKNFCPHVIVSFLTTCNIFSCVAAIGSGVPVIVSERNDPVLDCPSKLRRRIRDIAYQTAAGSIFQTEEAAGYFSKSIRKKSVIIPNPVKDNLPTVDLKKSRQEFVAAGRLTKQKNYPMMIKAFSAFVKDHPGYILKIYGEGELRNDLQELINSYGLQSQINLEGIVLDLHDRMMTANAFILSSDYEGISNSLLEALSMGLPCISTDCPCGGSRHLISNNDNGLLVPVGDVEALSKAMALIADQPSFAWELGRNAEKTRETHSEENIITQYFSFIRNVALKQR